MDTNCGLINKKRGRSRVTVGLVFIIVSISLIVSCDSLIPLRSLPVVEAPVFSQAAGGYDVTFDLAVTSATSGATIIYTTDGSDPSSTNGIFYKSVIPVAGSVEIRALAMKKNFVKSQVVSAEYTVVGIIALQQGSFDLPNSAGVYNTSIDTLLNHNEIQFTIMNSGSSDLVIHSIAIDSTSDAYSTTQAQNSTLPPGFTTFFTVTYDPSMYGITTATVTVISNDLTNGVYTFVITGNAYDGSAGNSEINLKQNTTDIISGSYDHPFGTTESGGSSTVIEFTIENSGTTDLVLLNSPFVEKTGTDPDQFTIVQPPGSLIEPAGSSTFSIRYTPVVPGSHTAIITIPNNDSNENPYTFTVSGTGVDTTPPVPGNSGLLSFGPIFTDQLKVNSTEATDNGTAAGDLIYRYYYSLSANIADVTGCETNGLLDEDWMSYSASEWIQGLSTGTLYYFNILVKDQSGNKAVYTMGSQMTD
jgi:hypothetical protein